MRRMPSGIVDQTIDPAVFFRGLVNKTSYLFGLGNIAFDKCRAPLVAGVQLGGKPIAFILAASAKNDLGPGIAKHAHAAFADAFCSAGYDDDLVFIIHTRIANREAQKSFD